ncbi:endonuclease Q family protein [Paenibacillus shenyangensis]|uniref:endonuclease Q family protein n=1 Tax=Paenibacillus sp. A9 TaxID=1284352 RepID=UPI00037E413E|nr:endonuclease Q family protein [Paenibacillus sp. A9]
MSSLQRVYADLHIHIGRSEDGQPVKISGSRNLTFANIAKESSQRKGIGLVGIIDCHSPGVQQDIRNYMASGEMVESSGGGIVYGDTTILLGSEIEIREPGYQEAHVLVYFRDLERMSDFSQWMGGYMKNLQLSSQRLYVSYRELQHQVKQRDGLFIPAHMFTPYKGIYGSVTPRMSDVLDMDSIDGGELGLSADTTMAGYLSELDRYPLLTNSDAHSLGKIGREYNVFRMQEANFDEFRNVLQGFEGRGIEANYGLDPRLGKYHRTYCTNCEHIIHEAEPALERCPYCGSTRLTIGVLDRILGIADRTEPQPPSNRPPYRYQVPLAFIPGLGPAKMNRLLEAFGTEMSILHNTSREELDAVVGAEIAAYIELARTGQLTLSAGGGGTYGKVVTG